MVGLLSFVAGQIRPLPRTKPPSDVKNGTYIVTGANTGLGYECAKHLLQVGAGRVIIAVRSLEKGNSALAKLRKETGCSTAGEVWKLDLTSLDSVEEFATRVNGLDRIDALIENAGVALIEFSKVGDLETSLLVNDLATMLLALRVLPKLQESKKKFNIQPHIAIVSSETGLFPVLKGVLDNLQGNIFETLSTPETMEDRYPLTKQLEIYAVRQLAALLPVSKTGVVVNAVNPGLCQTDLSRNATGLQRVGYNIGKAVLGRTAEEGSRTLLHGAFAGPASHGKYLSACEVRDDHLPEWMIGEKGLKIQQRVWDDLLSTLEKHGHAVDISNLGATID